MKLPNRFYSVVGCQQERQRLTLDVAVDCLFVDRLGEVPR